MSYPVLEEYERKAKHETKTKLEAQLNALTKTEKEAHPVTYDSRPVSGVKSELSSVGATLNRKEEREYLQERLEGRTHGIEDPEESLGFFGGSTKVKIGLFPGEGGAESAETKVKTKGGNVTMSGGEGTTVETTGGLKGIEAVGAFFNELGKATFWTRLLKGVLGLVLVLVAIWLLARAAGIGLPNPVLSATQKIPTSTEQVAKTAEARGESTRAVAPGQRKLIAEGRKREAARKPETGKTGKTLSGGAAQSRERRRVRERSEALK